MSEIELAPGAENNGFAVMLADLLRQNLESKPHKREDFAKLKGSVAIVAEDAEVALTLRFAGGLLTVHDGIVGRPDATIRGQSDGILALSNLPLRFGMPLPDPRKSDELRTMREVFDGVRSRKLSIHGMLANFQMLSRLTRVMSVNG